MDWSSPRSASTRPTSGRRVSSRAGTSQPHWASSTSTPTVFRATDLPPALGPLTTRARASAGISRSRGTTAARPAARSPPPSTSSKSGCRPPHTRRPAPAVTPGRCPPTALLHSRWARASSTASMRAAASARASRACSTARFSSKRMRASSAATSRRVSVRSLASEHHARRFHEQGGAGLGAVVDDARHLAAVARPQGQAEAVAAQGHLTGGGPALALGVGHGAVHRIAHRPLLTRQAAAQPRQQGAGPVDDAPVRVQAAAHGPAQPAEGGRLGRGLAPHGAALAQLQQLAAQQVQVLGRRGHAHQVGARPGAGAPGGPAGPARPRRRPAPASGCASPRGRSSSARARCRAMAARSAKGRRRRTAAAARALRQRRATWSTTRSHSSRRAARSPRTRRLAAKVRSRRWRSSIMVWLPA